MKRLRIKDVQLIYSYQWKGYQVGANELFTVRATTKTGLRRAVREGIARVLARTASIVSAPV